MSTEIVEPKEEGVKVFAGNLSYKATDDDLKAVFEPVGGEILSLQIVFRGQRSSGYGFVNYKNQEDAENAVQALNGKDIDGRALVVELAKAPQTKERKPKAKKNAAGRAPRAEDAVDGEDGEESPAGAVAEGEEKPKKKKAPRRKTKKAVAPADGETEGAPVDGDAAPAARAPRARKPKAAAAPRIDDDGNEIPAAPRERKPRAPRAPREAPTGEPSTTLVFVANLPFTLEDEGLKQIFTEAGVDVVSARIVKRKFGIRRSKGFGFVDTSSEEEQKKALGVDGKEIEARAIAVKVALNSQAAEGADETTPDELAQNVEALDVN